MKSYIKELIEPDLMKVYDEACQFILKTCPNTLAVTSVGSAPIVGLAAANDVDMVVLVQCIQEATMQLDAVGAARSLDVLEYPTNEQGFTSLRTTLAASGTNKSLNILLVQSKPKFQQWLTAQSVCEALSLKTREDRIIVYETIRNQEQVV